MISYLFKTLLFCIIFTSQFTLYAQEPFITTWTTENFLDSDSKSIRIPTSGDGYNYTVDWGDGTIDENVTFDITHEYEFAGIYTLKIRGAFPRIRIFDVLDPASFGEASQLLSIEQWGDIEWDTFENAFENATSLVIKAMDIPNLSNVKSMSTAFSSIKGITSDINDWDVSAVEDFSLCFFNINTFNQNLEDWEVGNAKNFSFMFGFCEVFNQDLSSWNLSQAEDLSGMFSEAVSYNSSVQFWDVTNVKSIANIFNGATAFNQDIGDWDISNVRNMESALSNSGMSMQTYEQTLKKWRAKPILQRNVSLGAANLTYCTGVEDRSKLIDNYNWSIRDDVRLCPLVPNAFVTKWRTDIEAFSNDNQILINTDESLDYNYTIDWGDGEIETITTANDIVHTYETAGTYIVSITGLFPRFISTETFNENVDSNKLIDVLQWGDIAWTSMESAFRECINMTISAIDIPDLSRVEEMSTMFRGATSLVEGGLANWEVSNVKSMRLMFDGATSFNENISRWNTVNLEDMIAMFRSANAFNQPIGDWEIGKVTALTETFLGASSFNQPLNDWDTKNLISLSKTFTGSAFNQPLDNWDVSNVTVMLQCFSFTSFNQNINNWDVSNVAIFSEAFSFNNAFNQPLDNWDVSKGDDFSSMFRMSKAFNQNLEDWNIISMFNAREMFNASAMSTANYDATLKGWIESNPQKGVSFGVNGLTFCEGEEARNGLIETYEWIFDGDTKNCVDLLSVERVKDNITSSKSINIFPNPASDVIFISQIDGILNSRIKYEIFDLQGRLIVVDKYDNEYGINIAPLEQGGYLIRFLNPRDNQIFSSVFVKGN